MLGKEEIIGQASMVDIRKYTSWFHDGDLKDIHHNKPNKSIVVTMSSSQIIDEEHFDKKVSLSKNPTIAGKLHLEGLQEVLLDDVSFSGELKKLTKSASILDFEISDSYTVSLGIQWFDFKNLGADMKYSYFTFKVKKYWWENVPSLDSES